MPDVFTKETHTQDDCRKLAPAGYEYGGYDGKYYLFQSGNYAKGFYPMYCLPEDMEPRNLALMAKMRLSRIVKRG